VGFDILTFEKMYFSHRSSKSSYRYKEDSYQDKKMSKNIFASISHRNHTKHFTKILKLFHNYGI